MCRVHVQRRSDFLGITNEAFFNEASFYLPLNAIGESDLSSRDFDIKQVLIIDLDCILPWCQIGCKYTRIVRPSGSHTISQSRIAGNILNLHINFKILIG